MLTLSDENRAEELMKLAEKDARNRWDLYRQMAAMHYEGPIEEDGDDATGSDAAGNGHKE
jgi:hypothetical protein